MYTTCLYISVCVYVYVTCLWLYRIRSNPFGAIIHSPKLAPGYHLQAGCWLWFNVEVW